MGGLLIALFVCFLLTASLMSQNSDKEKEMTIELVALGEIPMSVLHHLQQKLPDIFQAVVFVGQGKALPREAYDRKRQQYLSLPLLALLSRGRTSDRVNHKILGIMDEDVYTPGLNFIFGQAEATTGVAMISLTRLRQSFYGLAEDEDIFLERSLKEAVHEIGHLYGLGHCPDSLCVMHFSNSLSDTDRKSFRFCKRCQARLG